MLFSKRPFLTNTMRIFENDVMHRANAYAQHAKHGEINLCLAICLKRLKNRALLAV